MSRWSVNCLVMPMLLASLAGCTDGDPALLDESTDEGEDAIVNCSVDWEKELMITDLRVVGDARAQGNGPWSFGGVMRAMAGDNNEQEFVKRFMESWMTDQNVEGVVVPARTSIDDLVLKPWKAKSTSGTYDLAFAPFKLLAIVYRLDLRKEKDAGEGAGEGRFVYGVQGPTGNMMLFTLIAEFALPMDGGKSARDWANDWHSLGQLEVGSPEYNERLEAITNQFAGPSSRAGSRPGTALNQVRTNEIALDFGQNRPAMWQLREFHIKSDGYLRPARPALTPSNDMNGTNALKKYVQKNAEKIVEGTHKLPVKFEGSQFSAGAADVPNQAFTWDVPGVDPELAHDFSKQTCNGCHAGDTGTRFLHVGPGREEGLPARLSDFVLFEDMPKRVREFKKILGCQ